ncbi:MAG TPA: mycothione reductase [Propionibacteriaceae bacterium]|nr:mycothione reductase [Propionibacteriaceae bacterium]
MDLSSDVVDDHFDLAIVGSGSGNSLLDERFSGMKVALIDRGVFGGTCLNNGCIPTKMFVIPADYAIAPREAGRLGVDLTLRATQYDQIRDRVFGRIDPISRDGLRWREQSDNVTVFEGTASFDDPHTLSIRLNDGGGTRITADRFVLAAGSRPRWPMIPGLDAPQVAGRVHTSETIMRLDRLPRSLVILGGGFVAAEFAHVFAALGSKVTVINRSEHLLRQEDQDIAAAFTEEMAGYVSVRLGQQVVGLEADDQGLVVLCRDELGTDYDYPADVVLLAAGRIPNGDTLNLDAAGVDMTRDGFVVVDEFQRTTAPHVWALGDVCSPHMLKHVANAEMRTVQHNLLHPDDLRAAPHEAIPQAVFSHPQVASVGATEQHLVATGRRYVKAVQRYADVAHGWALEDERHFVKLLGDPDTGLLLGAHIIGPYAASLIQSLIQAMSFGMSYRGLARGQYWIHPAMTEVVENALLKLEEASAMVSREELGGL